MLKAAIKLLLPQPAQAKESPAIEPIVLAAQRDMSAYLNVIAQHDIPSYPDKGEALVAATAEELLATQHPLIMKIRDNACMDKAEFEALFMPVLRRYANWVHLLPASESHHHCGPGGLLRHGLEVCAGAARKAEGQYLGVDLNPSHRRLYAPRWKTAAALAGLLHDIGKPLVDIGAVDESGTLEWVSQSGDITRWINKHDIKNYYLYWRAGDRHDRHKAIGVSVAREIIGQEMLDWLTSDNCADVVDLLMLTISYTHEANNTMASIVSSADSHSVNADLAEQAKRNAGSGQGASRSLAARILAAIRFRVESGLWKINSDGSPIVLCEEGIYGIFPAVIEDPVNDLRLKGERGLPVDREEYLRVLADFHHIVPAIASDDRKANTWNLVRIPDETKKSLTALVTARAIKFATPTHITGALPMPPPIAVSITTPFKEDNAKPAAVVTMTAIATADDNPPSAPVAPVASSTPVTTKPSEAVEAAPAKTAAVAVEDRRDRVDAAKERAKDQERDLHAQHAGRSYEQWAKALENDSMVGLATRDLLEHIKSGKLVYGVDVMLFDDIFVVRHPEAFKHSGASSEGLLSQLIAKNWLRCDSATDRKTIEIEFPNLRMTKALQLIGMPLFAAKALAKEFPACMEFKKGTTPVSAPTQPAAAPAARKEPPARPESTIPKKVLVPSNEQQMPLIAITKSDMDKHFIHQGLKTPEIKMIERQTMSLGESFALRGWAWMLLANEANLKDYAHWADMPTDKAKAHLIARTEHYKANPDAFVEALRGGDIPLWESDVDILTIEGLPETGKRRDYEPPKWAVDNLNKIIDDRVKKK